MPIFILFVLVEMKMIMKTDVVCSTWVDASVSNTLLLKQMLGRRGDFFFPYVRSRDSSPKYTICVEA